MVALRQPASKQKGPKTAESTAKIAQNNAQRASTPVREHLLSLCTSGRFKPRHIPHTPRQTPAHTRCGPKPPLWGAGNRHFGSLRPASLRRHMRSAAPFSPQFCTCAPTAERRCPLGSVHAGEQPHRSRSATVSRSERSAQATRPPLAALATDLIASLISRPSASKLSMMDIVDREADAERPRGG